MARGACAEKHAFSTVWIVSCKFTRPSASAPDRNSAFEFSHQPHRITSRYISHDDLSIRPSNPGCKRPKIVHHQGCHDWATSRPAERSVQLSCRTGQTNGQTASYLAMDVLREYVEQEKMLRAQIKRAVREADQGNFATDDQGSDS